MNIAAALTSIAKFERVDDVGGLRHYRHENLDLLELHTNMLESDFLDGLIKTDLMVFVCSHTSSKGVASLTVHSEGNWSGEVKLGGKPRQISFASPGRMHDILIMMGRNNKIGLPVIYEATHHGPFLKTPSMFVEVGGDYKALNSPAYANVVAKSVFESLFMRGDEAGAKTVVAGFGGMHYADKFTRIAFDKDYAFSHIMPKYYINEVDMVEQAVDRSSIIPERAVIEWKSINAGQRNGIIKVLDKLGVDHERV